MLVIETLTSELYTPRMMTASNKRMINKTVDNRCCRCSDSSAVGGIVANRLRLRRRCQMVERIWMKLNRGAASRREELPVTTLLLVGESGIEKCLPMVQKNTAI